MNKGEQEMNRSTRLESENCLFQGFKFKHYLYCLEGTCFQFLTMLLYGMLVLGKIIICSFLSMLVHWVFRVCVCRGHACVFCLFAILWAVANQAPLSIGFSRQEYWSGLPFPPPDLPNPEIEHTSASPVSPALAGKFFITGKHASLPLC